MNRRGISLLLVIAVVATGCINGVKAGQRCRTADFGADATHVLRCQRGRWVRVATKAQVATLVIAILKARTTAPTPTAPTAPSGSTTAPAVTTPPPVPVAIDVATGTYHTCAALPEGSVKCWGRNTIAQLGNGLSGSSLTPTAVSLLTGVVEVDAGDDHTCARRSTGTMACWGYNQAGSLGDGGTVTPLTPVEVVIGAAPLSGVLDIGTGGRTTCSVQTTGSVFCWGGNNRSQVGDGVAAVSPPDRPTPVLVNGIPSAVQVTVGNTHVCVRTVAGAVWCWGDNQFGQITGTSNFTEPNDKIEIPVMVIASGAVDLSAGNFHSCAVMTAGSVQCWGSNSQSESTGSTSAGSYVAPTAVGGVSGAVSVAAGRANTCAVLSDATAKCWGSTERGSLGNGQLNSGTVQIPTQVGSAIGSIDMGALTVCLLGAARTELRCSGDNTEGQIGNGDRSIRLSPQTVAVAGATRVAASASFTCATPGTGVFCWGDNSLGQLGDGTTTGRLTPAPVFGLSSATITGLAVGQDHACAITSTTTVACWGYNGFGQVGAAPGSYTTPQTVGPFGTVIAISAGANTTCVINEFAVAQRRISCWGDNTFGQFGTAATGGAFDSTPNTDGPVGLYSKLSLGAQSTCAVLTGGAKCWGSDAEGQLGNGAGGPSVTPVDVTGLTTGVTDISVGGLTACAVRSSGTLQCWGNDDSGKADATFSNDGPFTSAQPAITGVTSATSVSAGSYGVCATRTAAVPVCWGSNSFGGIGDGTRDAFVDGARPVAVGNATAVASGGFTNFWITGGVLTGAGLSAFGQLGVGTSNVATPIPVVGL